MPIKSRFESEKDLLQIRLEMPASLRVRIDADELVEYVGKKLARLAKRNLKQGRNILGQPLPLPKADDDREGPRQDIPLTETGQLVNSIKYKNGEVRPDGGQTRIRPGVHRNAKTGKQFTTKATDRNSGRRGISKRAGSNYGLLSIHIVRGINGKAIDPFGTGHTELQAQIDKFTTEGIRKQQKEGKLKIVGEIGRALGFGAKKGRRKRR